MLRKKLNEMEILKTALQVGCQWLVTIILVTQEAEIRRIMV
jgi:hypothetical protein